MILTCELCRSQFLTESDPHIVIPGPETKIYCYCQVKGNEQKWIEQLKHEHKLYQKHLSGLKADNERLEAENAKLKEAIEVLKIVSQFTDHDAEVLGLPDGEAPTESSKLIKRTKQILKELENK